MGGASDSLHGEVGHITGVVGADSWLVAAGTSGPFTTATTIPAAFSDEARPLGGVRAADPLVLLHTATRRPAGLKDVNVVGYRLGGMGTPPVSKGRTVRSSGEVVADTRLHVRVGNPLLLGQRSFNVVGLARGVTYNFGTPTLFVSLADAQQLAFNGQPLAMGIALRGAPAVVPPGLHLVSDAAVRADLSRTLQSGTQTVDLIDGLLWLVAAGIIASIVYLSALERMRDFAVLKATGASSRSLYAGLALQALVLSLAAAILGVLVARAIQPSFPFAIELRAAGTVRLAVVAVVISLLASLAGLRRAVRVDPALAFGAG
jgi:putative ABC transport system permease protein